MPFIIFSSKNKAVFVCWPRNILRLHSTRNMGKYRPLGGFPQCLETRSLRSTVKSSALYFSICGHVMHSPNPSDGQVLFFPHFKRHATEFLYSAGQMDAQYRPSNEIPNPLKLILEYQRYYFIIVILSRCLSKLFSMPILAFLAFHSPPMFVLYSYLVGI